MSTTPITDAAEASNPLFAVDGKRYWTIPSEAARALEIAANGLAAKLDALRAVIGLTPVKGNLAALQEAMDDAGKELAAFTALQPKEPHE